MTNKEARVKLETLKQLHTMVVKAEVNEEDAKANLLMHMVRYVMQGGDLEFGKRHANDA